MTEKRRILIAAILAGATALAASTSAEAFWGPMGGWGGPWGGGPWGGGPWGGGPWGGGPWGGGPGWW